MPWLVGDSYLNGASNHSQQNAEANGARISNIQTNSRYASSVLPSEQIPQLFLSFVFDPTGNPASTLIDLPVTPNEQIRLRLLFSEFFSGTLVGGRVFSWQVDGTVPPEFANIDPIAESPDAGRDYGFAREVVITPAASSIQLQAVNIADAALISAVHIINAATNVSILQVNFGGSEQPENGLSNGSAITPPDPPTSSTVSRRSRGGIQIVGF